MYYPEQSCETLVPNYSSEKHEDQEGVQRKCKKLIEHMCSSPALVHLYDNVFTPGLLAFRLSFHTVKEVAHDREIQLRLLQMGHMGALFKDDHFGIRNAPVQGSR